MNDDVNYFAIIPCDVMYNTELSANAKLLYGTISSLTRKEGFCYASNNCLAKYYNVTPQAISKWIKILEDKGFVRIEYLYNGNEVKQRKIFILETFHKTSEKESDSEVSTDDKVSTKDEVSTSVDGGINKGLKGYQQKIKENNINTLKEFNNINSSSGQAAEEKLSKTELKTQNINFYLSTLSEFDVLVYQECVSLLFNNLKAKDPHYGRTSLQLLDWQYQFAKFAEKTKRPANEIKSTLDFAVKDSFWSGIMFNPASFIKNYEKLFQRASRLNNYPGQETHQRQQSQQQYKKPAFMFDNIIC